MFLVTVLGLLALFSFISILVSGDASEPQVDPRDNLPAWPRFGLRCPIAGRRTGLAHDRAPRLHRSRAPAVRGPCPF